LKSQCRFENLNRSSLECGIYRQEQPFVLRPALPNLRLAASSRSWDAGRSGCAADSEKTGLFFGRIAPARLKSGAVRREMPKELMIQLPRGNVRPFSSDYQNDSQVWQSATHDRSAVRARRAKK
jgi:hypothetical protein